VFHALLNLNSLHPSRDCLVDDRAGNDRQPEMDTSLIGRTAQTTLGPPKDRTIDFSDTTAMKKL
jgi:hypothetical protein